MPQRHGVQAVLPLCCGPMGCCTTWSGSWVLPKYRQRFGIHLPDCTVTQNTTSASMGTSKLIPPGLNAYHPFMTIFCSMQYYDIFTPELSVLCYLFLPCADSGDHRTSPFKKMYLFIYLWFIQWVSAGQATCCWMIGRTVDSEIKRMCKEAVVTWFEFIPWHLPGVTEENHNKPP